MWIKVDGLSKGAVAEKYDWGRIAVLVAFLVGSDQRKQLIFKEIAFKFWLICRLKWHFQG